MEFLTENWMFVAPAAVLTWLLVGFALGYAKALPRGREESRNLALSVWDVMRSTWDMELSLRTKGGDKLFGLVEDVTLKNGLKVAFIVPILMIMAFAWYHVTGLVFRDMFGEMAKIRLGPWNLAEALAFLVIAMELLTGYFLHDSWQSAFPHRDDDDDYVEDRRGRTGGPKRKFFGLFVWGSILVLLIVAEVMLAMRRTDLIVALVQQWKELDAADRATYAQFLESSRWVFVGISVLIPLFLIGLANRLHEVLPEAAKIAGFLGGGTVVAICYAAIAIACASLALVGGLLYGVGTIVIPLLSFLLVSIPLGICAVFMVRAREVLEEHRTVALLLPLAFLVMVGGCDRKAAANVDSSHEVIPVVESGSLAGKQIDVRCDANGKNCKGHVRGESHGRACIVDMSASNQYRSRTLSACVNDLARGDDPVFLLVIGSQSDDSAAPQLAIDKYEPGQCYAPEAPTGEVNSFKDVMVQKKQEKDAARAYAQCQGDEVGRAQQYRASREGNLAQFLAQYSRVGTGSTDIVGAFRRMAEWQRDEKVSTVSLTVYSDMEDTVTEAVKVTRTVTNIDRVQCDQLPNLDLGAVTTKVQETVVGRPWVRTEKIRRGWNKVLSCWGAPSPTFAVYSSR